MVGVEDVLIRVAQGELVGNWRLSAAVGGSSVRGVFCQRVEKLSLGFGGATWCAG